MENLESYLVFAKKRIKSEEHAPHRAFSERPDNFVPIIDQASRLKR